MANLNKGNTSTLEPLEIKDDLKATGIYSITFPLPSYTTNMRLLPVAKPKEAPPGVEIIRPYTHLLVCSTQERDIKKVFAGKINLPPGYDEESGKIERANRRDVPKVKVVFKTAQWAQ